MAGQQLSQQLTHDLFTAAFLPALDITTHWSVSLTSRSPLCCHHITLYLSSLFSVSLFSRNTQCPCSLLSSRSPPVSEAQSLATHHWTAHRQLWSPGPGWQQSPDTQKLVTARHDSFPRHAAERPVCVCGPVELPPLGVLAASTNMKSKFDSGSRGAKHRAAGAGNHPWQSLSWLHLASGTQGPGRHTQQ